MGSEMYAEERLTRIPQKPKDESECYLPPKYRRACKRMMGQNEWQEQCEKCWMRIDCAMIELRDRIFVVDHRIKEFDWNILQDKEIVTNKYTSSSSPTFRGW